MFSNKIKNQKAKFLGKNGSMGYITGQMYDITIYNKDGYIWVKCDEHSNCPYQKMVGLLKNWEFVQ